MLISLLERRKHNMNDDIAKKDEKQPLPGRYTFCAYAAACLRLKTVYVWGGMGELLTPETLRIKAELYPEHFAQEEVERLLEKADGNTRMFDCSGLIKWFLMRGPHGFQYDPAKDRNTLGLLREASASGSMDTMPETEGICLYMDGHVGIYVGGGIVIEATNNPLFGDGVVKTKLHDRAWKKWFCCKGIDYSDN